ncbi:MAG: hypothetical protein QG668_128 [Patescibacteria group bacterium]|nr:hypothetical protein [Patescibacteria group bacterium]
MFLMVGAIGLEPTASWSQTRRSSQLSYTPKLGDRGMVQDENCFAKWGRKIHTWVMRYFVDARMMGPLVTRGIGRVIAELLPRVIRRMPEASWVVLIRFPEQRVFFADIPGVEILEESIPWYGWQEQRRLPRLMHESGADAAIFFHWNIPWRCPVPFGVFLHDLILWHEPTSARISTRRPAVAILKRFVYRQLLQYIARRARWIGTPTEYVRQDVERTLPASRGKVSVIGEGVERVAEEVTSKRVGSLVVSSAYPHKQLELVLEAWKTVSKTFPDEYLRIVSAKDLFQARLRAWAERQGLERVEWIEDSVSDAVLARFYQQTRLFVFASRAEGFGLPPLEALMHGAPVLSSDAACMPEVLPPLGTRFFQSDSLSGMIEGWISALRDEALLRAQIPAARAWIRQHHAWDAAAERLVERIRTLE